MTTLTSLPEDCMHNATPWTSCLTAQLLFTKNEPLCAQKLGGSIALHNRGKHENTAPLSICKSLSLSLNTTPAVQALQDTQEKSPSHAVIKNYTPPLTDRKMGKMGTHRTHRKVGELTPLPLAPPSDHWYGGLSVSLGDSEAWKPQKVGGCGWTRCPRNSVLSHVAQDTARSWFWARLTRTVHIQAILGHFWAVSRTYRGVRGQQKALCHRANEAHVECSNRFPSFGRFLLGFGAVLGQKRLFWGTKCAVLGGHLPTWRPRPGVPPVSFWLKTWIRQGHHLGSRMARVEQSPER